MRELYGGGEGSSTMSKQSRLLWFQASNGWSKDEFEFFDEEEEFGEKTECRICHDMDFITKLEAPSACKGTIKVIIYNHLLPIPYIETRILELFTQINQFGMEMEESFIFLITIQYHLKYKSTNEVRECIFKMKRKKKKSNVGTNNTIQSL